jgi:hypothetical protein
MLEGIEQMRAEAYQFHQGIQQAVRRRGPHGVSKFRGEI